MWKKLVKMLSLMVVCLCAAGLVGSTSVRAAGGPAWICAADINTPWIPAEHFTVAWESVSLTSQIYNPVEKPNYSDSRSLAVSTAVDVIDTNGIIGLSWSQRGILALDQNGKTIYSTSASLPKYRTYRSPTSLASLVPSSSLASQLLTQHYTATIPMDPNTGYPTKLSKLEWSIDALVADTTKQVDIPFAATTEWAQIVPGLEIMVEQASTAGTAYSYSMKVRYDATKVQLSFGGIVTVSDAHPLAKMVLIRLDVLRAQGATLSSLSSSPRSYTSEDNTSSSDNQATATIGGSGSCSSCGAVTGFRMVFAVDPYEKEVHFALEDIPVPTF